MMRKQRGMTLVEMMVALAVGIFLLAVGIPSFTNMMQSNRASGVANDLISAFRLARSEAVKRGSAVSVCASNVANDDCSGNDWQNGWLVFTDPAGGVNGALDAGETIIRAWPAMEGNPTIDGAAVPNFVRFRPDGALASSASAITAGDFSFEPQECRGQQAKQILIESTGQSRIQSIDCVN